MPEDTIEEKALKAAALGLLGAEEIDEAKKGGSAWSKRGYMVKVRKGAIKSSTGRTGPELVNSMLGAMIAKGAISRKTDSSEYKAPGAQSASYSKAGVKGSGQGKYNHEPAAAPIKGGTTTYGQGSEKFPWYSQKGKVAQKGKQTAQKAGKKKATDKTPDGKKKTYKAAVSMKKAKEVAQAKKSNKGNPLPAKGNKPKKAAGFESRADGGSLVTESIGLTARMFAHRNAAAERDKKAITG
jgi:hypothetical protein